MSWTNPIIWQEGMFLRAQHFQQLGRWAEAQVRGRTAALGAFWWGFSDLAIDQKKLETGHFALISASGVFIDATPFAIPSDTDNPASLPVDEKSRGSLVYLCVPAPSLDAAQVAHNGSGATGRYAVKEFSAFDTFPGDAGDPSDPALLLVGRLQLRFMLENEDRRGWQCLPVARIAEVGSEHRITLDEEWIPPVTRAGASPRLVSFLNNVHARLQEKSRRLAAQLPVVQSMAHVVDLMFLQAANRWLKLTAHWLTSSAVHPEALYAAFVQMAGEFATFAEPGRRLDNYPGYVHDDLQLSFTRLVADLERLLGHERAPEATQIELERKNNWFRGRIYNRDLLKPGSATFYLVALSDRKPDAMRREFPGQVAIGAVAQLQALVSAAIPGVMVIPLPTNPLQLTRREDAAYFELDRGSVYWEQIRASASIGLHVTDMFPRIALELWVVQA